ncbi:Dual 3',5'-cyclic-AMP and -GMP phosphodiesterase 11A [Acipenser ruthenus]|uniref:Dual 3',5'-cyclic-AMP and-GMP phosphodiesterase 11A n=1 Tax=Acipenser ruthenus TaxID=7906 RepID=A0A444TXE3_ACIRT|nr:Dual 3',5'-cyclic-AMP and -GMP phosphodiesterase 11A [Acipenser ruthenus]
MHKTSSQKPVCDSSQCLTSLDHRFSDEIDKLAVYKTKSILCMAIHNSDGEVTGVVQAINKNPNGAPFTEGDEKLQQCVGQSRGGLPGYALTIGVGRGSAIGAQTFYEFRKVRVENETR